MKLKYIILPIILSLIHISEPTRQAEISYAVFCLKKKKQTAKNHSRIHHINSNELDKKNCDIRR